MTIENAIRLIAGLFISISIALGYWFDPKWYLLTAFVGFNLLQSGITGWCPMMTILAKLGLKESNESGCSQ